MRNSADSNCGARSRPLTGRDLLVRSVAVSLPVIGLDQFLRTPVASYAAQPLTEAGHWITDSLMAVPFFAFGAWAGDAVAGWAKIGTARNLDLLKRSVVSALASGLALAPAFFVINKADNPMRAQPLVFPQAHNSGDVYSVAPAVVAALVSACLIPAALWAGRAVARAITRSESATSRLSAVMRTALPALLAAAVPVLAWLMYQTAGHAYATQVYYPRAQLTAAARRRPPPLPGTASRLAAAPHPGTAPDALISQTLHAVQDGLAGQAAGIPAAAATTAALLSTRVPRYRGKHRQALAP